MTKKSDLRASPAPALLRILNPQPIELDMATDQSAAQAVADVLAHLRWLESRHNRKVQSDAYLTDGCFERSRQFGSQPEVNAYCRIHVRVATRQFSRLIQGIEGPGNVITLDALRAYREMITDYLFDLIPIVDHLERPFNPEYAFIKGGKNAGVHSWELFVLSQQLALQSTARDRHVHLDHKAAQIASILVLRQALELRFERIVAVYPQDKKGKAPRLRHGFHYDFILANPQFFTFLAVDFARLKKIYDWCNEIVHQAYQPFAWQIALAHQVCGELMRPRKAAPDGSWAIHNGVEISDLLGMQLEFGNYFAANYDHGIWSIQTGKPEAVVR